MSEQEIDDTLKPSDSIRNPRQDIELHPTDETIDAREESNVSAADFETLYVTTLSQKQRSIEAQGLEPDDTVIHNPEFPSEIMPDSPAMREEFRRRLYIWTNESRAAAWFPAKELWSEEFTEQIAQCQTRRQAFSAAIAANAQSLEGRRMPSPRLPFFIRATGLNIYATEAETVADLTDQFCEVIHRETVPEIVSVTDDWIELAHTLNHLSIYRVKTQFIGRPTIDIVCGFVSPMLHSGTDDSCFVHAQSIWIDTIRRLYDQWIETNERADFTCFSIGTPIRWTDDCEALEDKDSYIAISEPNGESDQDANVLVEADLLRLASDPIQGDNPAWKTKLPAESTESGDVRALLDRMQPETRAERIARIRRAIDQLLDDRSYEGTVHVDLLAEKTGYRRQLVLDAMDQLQKTDEYKCILWQHSQPARIIIVRANDPQFAGEKNIKRIYTDPHWRRIATGHFMTLAGAAASVVGAQLVVWQATGSFSLSALLIGVPVWFVTRSIQVAMMRKACEI